MEDNIQEVVVEEAVVQEAETPVDTSVSEPIAEAPIVEDNTLDIDFSDLGPDDYMPAPQPSNEDIVEQIAARLANRLQPAPSVEAQFQQPGVDDVVTKAELQAMFQQMQEQQEAQRTIQETVRQATAVQDGYVQKLVATLNNNGIDLEADPALKTSCDLLYKQMFAQKVQQLGRSAPVLTAAETKELVQDHFKIFNEIYLQNKIQKKSQPVQNLSPVSNAAPHQGQTTKVPDEYTQFLEKKKQGTVTMKDIANILAKPTQKK